VCVWFVSQRGGFCLKALAAWRQRRRDR
jgi:hypothetical protein